MKYVILTSQAKMPSSCWGKYGRVAILEIKEGMKAPRIITDRAKSVIRIVRTWENRFCGKTNKSAFYKALEEAQKIVNESKHIKSPS